MLLFLDKLGIHNVYRCSLLDENLNFPFLGFMKNSNVDIVLIKEIGKFSLFLFKSIQVKLEDIKTWRLFVLSRVWFLVWLTILAALLPCR